MKTLESMIYDADVKRSLWEDIANDPQALADRGKTREEALYQMNYFEGRLDALREFQSL
ncbi:MAG: hypothetical protein GY833_22885 [Aestuariibacter sp.]|nr:hypothetical protein [Aestuariibacter sp.]|tara:strand:- start:195775 stop:195951 length:177 start_codon:yes stop_codon:yes gene_type:complete